MNRSSVVPAHRPGQRMRRNEATVEIACASSTTTAVNKGALAALDNTVSRGLFGLLGLRTARAGGTQPAGQSNTGQIWARFLPREASAGGDTALAIR